MRDKAYFTVDEASRMIPLLERSFQRIFQINDQMDRALEELQDTDINIAADAADTTEVNEADYAYDENTFNDLIDLKLYSQALENEVEYLQNQGCVVKDLREGLIDWYAYEDGREIVLCWQYGEKQVDHWHELNGGYKNRRPVNELINA